MTAEFRIQDHMCIRFIDRGALLIKVVIEHLLSLLRVFDGRCRFLDLTMQIRAYRVQRLERNEMYLPVSANILTQVRRLFPYVDLSSRNLSKRFDIESSVFRFVIAVEMREIMLLCCFGIVSRDVLEIDFLQVDVYAQNAKLASKITLFAYILNRMGSMGHGWQKSEVKWIRFSRSGKYHR